VSDSVFEDLLRALLIEPFNELHLRFRCANQGDDADVYIVITIVLLGFYLPNPLSLA
jgi:hypothetical protein